MQPALEVNSVTVHYGPAAAVREVSLTAHVGAITGITGNNGAGKSTLIHTMMGLIRPKNGRVRLFADEVTAWSPRRRATAGLALVPEGRHVFADQTVMENLRLGFIGRDGVDFASARDRALSLFPELREHQHRPAGALSGGQQQMLAVARAVVSSPKVLLLDEPFLGLAPLVVDRLRENIRFLADEGTTILVSDSAALRLLEFCDYCYVVRIGEIAAHGTSTDLLQNSNLRRLLLGGA